MNFKTVKTLIFKQYQLGTWIGWLRAQFASAQFYPGFVQLLMICAMFYSTTFREWSIAHPGFLWVSFPVFIIVLIIGDICLMFFEWKIVAPSCFLLSNQQAAKHGSPIIANQREILERLERLENQNKIILGLRNDSENKA